MPFCSGAAVLMLQLQISQPPTPPSARTQSQSVGHISYYSLSLSYTRSCLYTRARWRRIQQLVNQPLLFFPSCFLATNAPCLLPFLRPTHHQTATKSQSHSLFDSQALAVYAHAQLAPYHCSVRVLCISSQRARYPLASLPDAKGTDASAMQNCRRHC